MKDFNLRPVWDATLEVYKAVAALCDKHHLRYYVTYGCALGAVRHRGFIPWDDDFDMSMPREDYQRFIALATKELPPYLKFVNWRNTPEFSMLCGKIQDVREDRIKSIEKSCGRLLSNGI